MKILCALLPHFPLRCEVRRQTEIKADSAVITYNVGSQKLVLDYSYELEGLQQEMSLQQALSRHGEVALIQADIPYYWSAFNEILDALEKKSPLVEGSELGQVYIGIDGLQLIYPTHNILVEAMRKAIPGDFAAQMGIAEGKFPAYLSALQSSQHGYYEIETQDVGVFLKDLSCDVLPISMKDKDKLKNFGLHTLGKIASLEPGPIQSQFGPEGQRIWELVRGYDDTPLYPRCTEEVIDESTVLPSVTVSLEAMLVTLESLLSRAFIRLTPRGMGIRSVLLWTRTWNSGYWERIVKFKEPAMNIGSAISRMKRVMNDYPQPGPVELLGMRITGLGRRRGSQKSLFSEVRARDRLNDDIKQLELRLGSPQVYKIKEVEPWSRIPERRYTLAPLSQ